jgi:hypothetical protein
MGRVSDDRVAKGVRTPCHAGHPNMRGRAFVLAGLAIFLASGPTVSARGTDRVAPTVSGVWIDNGSTRYEGDGPLLATISPNGDDFRDGVRIGFTLNEGARVTFRVVLTGRKPQRIGGRTVLREAGSHILEWFPRSTTPARTYVVELSATDAAGNSWTNVRRRPAEGARRQMPVIRVQGIDASFTRTSYVSGERARLTVATDAASLYFQLFRSGPEQAGTPRHDLMRGVPVSPLRVLSRAAWRNRPQTVEVQLESLASGLYFARLTAPDGRLGFAPFVIRPTRLGTNAVAIVLPTLTWQAYNFQDLDGNGWADTWYADFRYRTVRLGRPYVNRGVPPFFRLYDRPFL